MLTTLLSIISIFASISILVVQNIITALFCLILTSLCFSIIFIIIGREFIGFIFLIVYIGAICILFLFVLMMLNIHYSEREDTKFTYFSLGIFFSIIMLLLFTTYTKELFIYESLIPVNQVVSNNLITTNIEISLVSSLLYNYFSNCLIVSSLILLVAMFNAIIISLESLQKDHYTTSRRQDIFSQITRELTNCVSLFTKIK